MNAAALARIVLLCWPLLTLAVAPNPALASTYQDAPHEVGIAAGSADKVIESCLLAAASAHRVPPAVLVILLNVEGGKLGRVSANTNGTVDIGPMQVNEIWLPEISQHWRAPVGLSFLALRDNFCPTPKPAPTSCAKVSMKRMAIFGVASASIIPTIRPTKRPTCARCSNRRCACRPR